jgi:hypothetical protein
VILGLEFSDDVGPATIVTVSLAIVAIIGLYLTARSLKQTQNEIGLSRAAVKEAHRPVVVPFVDSGQTLTIASTLRLPARPNVPHPGLLVLPVKNIGPGPALQLEATIEGLDPAGERSGAWSGARTVGVVATTVGADEMTPLEIELSGVGEVPGFGLSLVYHDVAGKRWHTFARWIPNRDRYEDLAIQPDTISS